MDGPINDLSAVQYEQTDKSEILAKKHNDETLAITLLIAGIRLIAYHFW